MTDGPSIPSFYLHSACLSSTISALGYTSGISASKQLKNLLCTPFFPYFNSGDALRKKTSKPRIKAEMLDGWEDVKGIVHHQGLSYVSKVIRTELISRHHNEGTSASIQLKNLLPGNLKQICNCRLPIGRTQAILIPTPMCLTELTSRRKRNCNIMITGCM